MIKNNSEAICSPFCSLTGWKRSRRCWPRAAGSDGDGGRHVAAGSWRSRGLGEDHSPAPFPGNLAARLEL